MSAPRSQAHGEASRLAEDIIQQMEALVVKELPRVAGTFTTALERIHHELEQANREVERLRKERQDWQLQEQRFRFQHDDDALQLLHLRQLYTDLERLHEQDERRLVELEGERQALTRERSDDAEKLAAVEQFLNAFRRS